MQQTVDLMRLLILRGLGLVLIVASLGCGTRDSARASKNQQGPMRQVTVEGVDFVVDIQVTSQLNFNYVGDTL